MTSRSPSNIVHSRPLPRFRGGAFLSALLALAHMADAGAYEAIRGRSTLTYGMEHPMHKFKGVSKDFTCIVDLSADTLSSAIKVSAEVKSFNTGNSSRDSHALEVVNAYKYPKVEFTGTSISRQGDGYDVGGTLSFHGQTRPVQFHITPKYGAGEVEITGAFKVKLTDFGIDPPSLLFIRVKDEFTVSFDLFAKNP